MSTFYQSATQIFIKIVLWHDVYLIASKINCVYNAIITTYLIQLLKLQRSTAVIQCHHIELPVNLGL